MSEEGVPDSVLQFIARHIESLEPLEILLLLADDPARRRSVAEIFQKIQSSQASVQQRLAQLEAAGLVARDEKGYRFHAASEDVAQCVAALAENYRLRRVRVIEAIYARKTDVVQTFADAFKLRRKDQ